MKEYIRRLIQNGAIILLFMIGVLNLILALPINIDDGFLYQYSTQIDPAFIIVPHTLSFVFGWLMLLIIFKLYKRLRYAWLLELLILTSSIVLHIIQLHRLMVPIVFIEIVIFIILLISFKDFHRISNRMTIKNAVFFVMASFLLILINASIGLLLHKAHIENIDTLSDAIESSLRLLFLMDTSNLDFTGSYGKIYVDTLIGLNWFCISISLIMLLKPLIYNPIVVLHEKDLVRKLVLSYGQNPMSYLALEDDKKYFFGNQVNGVCAYQVVANVFVVCGDMICDKKDGVILLGEISTFCKQNGYTMLFLNVTNEFLDLYKMADFGVLKYGEDACFDLDEYNLKGGKVAKVRAAINHATKAGITVHEYKPLLHKDIRIEQQIQEISEEWLINKGGNEMGFMLGGTGLRAPLDRRYFYAVNQEGDIYGFVVFLPYLNRKAYLADVTRRRTKAPQGVLEKIIYEGFMVFKEEGAKWGNMGLSPLYHIADSDHNTISAKLFDSIYENMNNGYNFKALHHAKEKYAPTHWIPRYIVYSPKPFNASLAYAMVRVQMKEGLFKMALSEFRKKEVELNEEKK